MKSDPIDLIIGVDLYGTLLLGSSIRKKSNDKRIAQKFSARLDSVRFYF